jgi:hypothetical protein
MFIATSSSTPAQFATSPLARLLRLLACHMREQLSELLVASIDEFAAHFFRQYEDPALPGVMRLALQQKLDRDRQAIEDALRAEEEREAAERAAEEAEAAAEAAEEARLAAEEAEEEAAAAAAAAGAAGGEGAAAAAAATGTTSAETATAAIAPTVATDADEAARGTGAEVRVEMQSTIAPSNGQYCQSLNIVSPHLTIVLGCLTVFLTTM